MDPTIDRAKIHLTMNVDAQGNPSGGGGGGGGDASAANQALEIAELQDINAALNDSTPAAVYGATAHDSSVSSVPPVISGGEAGDAIPTAVSADGDAVRRWSDRYGRGIVAAAPRARIGRAVQTITSDTAEKDLIAAGAAGVFRDVYRLVITNRSATAVNVTIRDVAAGGTPMIYAVPAGETRGFSGPVDAASLQTTAANKWTATCSASVDNVHVEACYVERKA